LDTAIPGGQSSRPAEGGLGDRDLYFLRMMLGVNASWLVTAHNGHVVKIEPVGKPLHASSVPTWWIAYAEANDLELKI